MAERAPDRTAVRGAWIRGLVAFMVAFGIGLSFVRLDERARGATLRSEAYLSCEASARSLERLLDRVTTTIELDPSSLRGASVRRVLRPIGEGADADEDEALAGLAASCAEGGSGDVFGPYQSARGAFLLVVRFDANATSPPCAVRAAGSLGLAEVLAESGVTRLESSGYDYALSLVGGDGREHLVARSTELALPTPIVLRLQPGRTELRLSVAPRTGWLPRGARVRKIGLALLASALFAILAHDVIRRPERLEAEIARRSQKLVAANRETMAEIVERQKAETRLLFEASHDRLSGLHNREFLLSRLERSGGTLLLIGIDRFRALAEGLGSTAGDLLLVGTARRLGSFVRLDDVAARTGDAEFALLLASVSDAGTAASVASRLRTSLEAPYHIDGHEVRTTVSVGLFLHEAAMPVAEERLRNAGLALHKARQDGAHVAVYSSDLADTATHQVRLEEELRVAIETSQLYVVFQPIVSLVTGSLTGFEALVRWRHPVRGPIPPAQFIPLAESTGLVVALDRWVWRSAAATMKRLHERFPDEKPTVSVNLSTRQLKEPDLVDDIADVLATSGFPAASFRLEITESMMLENRSATLVLERLKLLGVKLLLDDFGTGYSSLSYLHDLPIDILKIDRSFVSRLGTESKHEEIVKTILALSRGLGLDVVSEGIETADQLAHLRRLGCGYAQGYFFSRPIDEDQLEPLLASRRRW